MIAYRTLKPGTGKAAWSEGVLMVAEKQAAGWESMAAMSFELLRVQQAWMLGALTGRRPSVASATRAARSIATRGTASIARRVGANTRRLRGRAN